MEASNVQRSHGQEAAASAFFTAAPQTLQAAGLLSPPAALTPSVGATVCCFSGVGNAAETVTGEGQVCE